MKTYKVGIIAIGSMGSNFLKTFNASARWEVAYVCDLDDERLAWAQRVAPGARATKDAMDIMRDPEIDVVGIFTLADNRPALIKEALIHGKHILAEKPIGDSVEVEEELLELIERSDRIVAVNLFNRNTWYYDAMQEFVKSGQIGESAIISVTHETPGIMPGEGHQPEGPPFHDCGMHYVDIVRWFAGSEFATWQTQGVRMWGWQDPWWVHAHGTFENGKVFRVTQGFTYGQLAQKRTNRSEFEVIGTQGLVRMRHDMGWARVEFHGISETYVREAAQGGKNMDVLCEKFAHALDTGDTSKLPTARDSVIASKVSWAMLDQAAQGNPPVIGTPEEMERIIKHRNDVGISKQAFIRRLVNS